jgi:hypothetical protein
MPMTEPKTKARKVIRLTPREMDRALELSRERYSKLRDLVADLLATLPACDNHPDRPATRALRRGVERYCDECGSKYPDMLVPVPEYPRAQALRRLVELVGGT